MALDISRVKEFDFIRFTFTDLNGILRGKTVPKENTENCMTNGVQAYSGAIAFGPRSSIHFMPQVIEVNHCNGIYKPVPDTLHELSWSGEGKYRVGQVLCEGFWLDHTPLIADPRQAATRQLQRLEKRGFSLLSSFEIEFHLVDSQTQQLLFDCDEIYHQDIFSKNEMLFFDVCKGLSNSGVKINVMHTEYGPGQYEVSLIPVKGIAAADNVLKFRQAVKEIARKYGRTAYFMTKPFLNSSSSGAHFNHSLWKLSDTPSNGDANAFQGDEKHKLSLLASYWMAGILAHAPALTALCCPTVNCYWRIGLPWAPGRIYWGVRDRFSLLRAKPSLFGKDTYLENRLPSGAANPYLALAATVAAGLDGIDRKLELPPAGVQGEKVPRSLDEALSCLEQDKILAEALGEELIQWFLICRRNLDLEELKFPPDISEADRIKAEHKMYCML